MASFRNPFARGCISSVKYRLPPRVFTFPESGYTPLYLRPYRGRLPGVINYDPTFKNTAFCKSAITFIDGEKGILRYGSYPIEQLAKNCSFLVVAAAAALSSPLHGGAIESVLKMLDEIGSKDRVPAYVERVKEAHVRLTGFGHRVYENYDLRTRIIKWAAEQASQVTGTNPKLETALELEQIALEDEYFIKRKLYPSLDFYSAIIYQASGCPPEMFTVLFANLHTVGWLAPWQEMPQDSEQKIARPRQIYIGYEARDFVPIKKRSAPVSSLTT